MAFRIVRWVSTRSGCCAMVQDAHARRAEGVDVVVGLVETYGRADTDAQVKDLEIIPRRRIDYRGVVLDEMDVDAIIARKPRLCIVDELAHSNVPLNDAVGRVTGVGVRETGADSRARHGLHELRGRGGARAADRCADCRTARRALVRGLRRNAA
jgi:osmosensitive K+ channel His kinase sensor protein